MLKNKKVRRNRGFTLIELLVVVAIIGMLSSVVLVSLVSAKTKAENSVTMQNLRQVQLAMLLYFHDNNSFPNPANNPAMYCIGAPSCTFTLEDGSVVPVPNQLAIRAIPIENGLAIQKSSLFSKIKSIFIPTTVMAYTYSVGLGDLAKLNHPLLYYCNYTGLTCPDGSAYVLYSQKSSNTTTYYAQMAGQTTGTTYSDWGTTSPSPTDTTSPTESPTDTTSPTESPSESPTESPS